MAKVLVIGAHPDDADFKAGGTASLWKRHGVEVVFVSVTDGSAGHQAGHGPRLAERRRAEAAAAGAVLGIRYLVLDHPDGRLLPTLEARLDILRLIRREQPDLVLTHRPNDYHPDHRYTAQLVADAAYIVTVPAVAEDVPPLTGNPVFGYLSDEFTKPCPFAPDVVVDVDSEVDAVVRMLDCHVSQVYEWLPFNMGFLDRVSPDPDERRRALWSLFGAGHARVAERFRPELARTYGTERGATIQAAEAFEISEYGSPLTAERRRALFPFLPN